MHQFGDYANALFEFLGAFWIALSIKRLYADKIVRGLAWQQVAFWTAWGYWNLFYYWAVNSPASWWAGVLVTLANTTYTAMLVYYVRKEKRQ